MKLYLTPTLALFSFFLLCLQPAFSQSCANQGDLDTIYCDANRDMVADAPETKLLVKPSRLILGFAAVEDAKAYEIYNPFFDHLSKCTGVPTSPSILTKEAEVIQAMRDGKVHIGSFATGATMFAVNMAGSIPFAGKGRESEGKPDQYNLIVLVKADSPYTKLPDLKGKVVAHTTQTSNSGNLAPRALFPENGLTPDKDYKVEYSGKHDKSILGVQYGFWQAAAVATDVYERMIARGEIKARDFRIIYTSEGFPPDAFGLAHNIEPAFAKKIKDCFYTFKFPAAMSKGMEGNNRFYPVDYKKDWQVVRLVARAAGQRIDRAAYDKLLKGGK